MHYQTHLNTSVSLNVPFCSCDSSNTRFNCSHTTTTTTTTTTATTPTTNTKRCNSKFFFRQSAQRAPNCLQQTHMAIMQSMKHTVYMELNMNLFSVYQLTSYTDEGEGQTRVLEKTHDCTKSHILKPQKFQTRTHTPALVAGWKADLLDPTQCVAPNTTHVQSSAHESNTKSAQVTIFRLKTGYCQLLSHLHK